MRTGRWAVSSLEKTEKTYIGTKVEILFKFDFELPRGTKLDFRLEDTEVDIKCTVLKDWMIPKEAVGELCLLVRIDDLRSKFWIGVIRATPSVLRIGENRDKKSSLSAEGKKSIHWLVEAGQLPVNLLATLDPETREKILSHRKSGQARINELFRLMTSIFSENLVCRRKSIVKPFPKTMNNFLAMNNLGGQAHNILFGVPRSKWMFCGFDWE